MKMKKKRRKKRVDKKIAVADVDMPLYPYISP